MRRGLWLVVLLPVLLGLLVAMTAGATTAGATTARATGSVKVYFVRGQQLVSVPRTGSTVKAAVMRLIAGPAASPLSGHTATVDLSAAFADAGNVEARTARLAQIVYTVASVPGVTSVRVLIEGSAPQPALYPGFDLTMPVTRADIARPKFELREGPSQNPAPRSSATRKLQQRLAELGYLPATAVDGISRVPGCSDPGCVPRLRSRSTV